MFRFKNTKIVLMKLKKIKSELVEREFSTLHEKNTDSATSTFEANENVFVFVFISSLVSFEVWFYVQYFGKALRNQTENIY